MKSWSVRRESSVERQDWSLRTSSSGTCLPGEGRGRAASPQLGAHVRGAWPGWDRGTWGNGEGLPGASPVPPQKKVRTESKQVLGLVWILLQLIFSLGTSVILPVMPPYLQKQGASWLTGWPAARSQAKFNSGLGLNCL